MMTEMAKWDFIRQVIFVNPTVSVRRIVKWKPNPSQGSGGAIPNFFFTRISSKIFVYTPITFFPFKKVLPGLGNIENRITLKVIQYVNKGNPYILFMNCPNMASPEILDELLAQAKLSFFDFSDDFLELVSGTQEKKLYGHNITKYAGAADVVLTVNEHVKQKYAHLNTCMHVIRNGTNYENFNRQASKPIAALEKWKQTNKPIIGYIGTANMGRIDSDLLDYLVEKRPDWQFVFIGTAHANFRERYARYDNVHIIGPVHYQELPSYIGYFNVAFVPFSNNEHTKGNDLLKLHDCLAMGKPIVSTEIGGAKDLKDVVRMAGAPSEFLKAIEAAIGSDRDEDVAKRKKVALENSWPHRVKELERLSRKALNIGITKKVESGE